MSYEPWYQAQSPSKADVINSVNKSEFILNLNKGLRIAGLAQVEEGSHEVDQVTGLVGHHAEGGLAEALVCGARAGACLGT